MLTFTAGYIEVWRDGVLISKHRIEREAYEAIENHGEEFGDGEYLVKFPEVKVTRMRRNINRDTAPPTTPVLTATAAGTTIINLTWTASSDNIGVARYKIDRSTDQVAWTTDIFNSTGLSYSDTGRSEGTRYYYRIRALDAVGNASGYGYANALTPITDTQAPTSPTLTATTDTMNSASQINLSCTVSTDNVAVVAYTFERASSASVASTYAQSASGQDGWTVLQDTTSRTYNDTSRVALTTYYYRCSARDAAGNRSVWSSASATTLQSQVAQVYFSDDWATGNNSQWSQFSSGYAGSPPGMPVSTTFPFSGTYCCSRAMTQGQQSLYGLYKEYGTSGNLSSQIRNFWAQFSIAFDSFSGNWPASQQKLAIFQYFDSSGAYSSISSNGNRRYQVIPCLDPSGYFSIYLVQWNPANAGAFVQQAWITSSVTPTRGSWDTIRLRVQLETTADGTLGVNHGNGILQVWVNNTQVINYTNVNFTNADATQGMGRIFVTSEGSAWAGSSTTMYWDRLQVASDSSVLDTMPNAPTARTTANNNPDGWGAASTTVMSRDYQTQGTIGDSYPANDIKQGLPQFTAQWAASYGVGGTGGWRLNLASSWSQQSVGWTLPSVLSTGANTITTLSFCIKFSAGLLNTFGDGFKAIDLGEDGGAFGGVRHGLHFGAKNTFNIADTWPQWYFAGTAGGDYIPTSRDAPVISGVSEANWSQHADQWVWMCLLWDGRSSTRSNRTLSVYKKAQGATSVVRIGRVSSGETWVDRLGESQTIRYDWGQGVPGMVVTPLLGYWNDSSGPSGQCQVYVDRIRVMNGWPSGSDGPPW